MRVERDESLRRASPWLWIVERTEESGGGRGYGYGCGAYECVCGYGRARGDRGSLSLSCARLYAGRRSTRARSRVLRSLPGHSAKNHGSQNRVPRHPSVPLHDFD